MTSSPRIAAVIFEDVALLDLLVTGKLGRAADALREAEGWKWTEAHLDFPHAHGMRRTYPHPVELSVEDQAALDAAQAEFNRLTERHETAEELPDEVDARFGELEAEIERLEGKRQAYDPDHIVRGGAFVILNHDGTVRIERGFIRTEDEKPQAREPRRPAMLRRAPTLRAVPDGRGEEETGEADRRRRRGRNRQSVVGHPCPRPHRASHLGAAAQSERAAGSRHCDRHPCALRANLLSRRGRARRRYSVRSIRTLAVACGRDRGYPERQGMGGSSRQLGKADAPRRDHGLWTFVSELDHDSRMALLAHCVALTVNAVRLPWERKPRAMATADRLAEAVSLDMTGYWRPTVRSYFGRVTKARILEAVREGVSHEAADRMADMKKPDMAEAAEQLLAATDWLPALMRTPKTGQSLPSKRRSDTPRKRMQTLIRDAAE